MVKYQTELLCPNCGEIIEGQDCYDIEITTIEDGQVAEVNHCIGYCANCGGEYRYDEVYTLAGYANIEAV